MRTRYTSLQVGYPRARRLTAHAERGYSVARTVLVILWQVMWQMTALCLLN